MKSKTAVLLQCILLLCTQSASVVNIEMVTVGNPGNAPDMRYNLDQRPEATLDIRGLAPATRGTMQFEELR